MAKKKVNIPPKPDREVNSKSADFMDGLDDTVTEDQHPEDKTTDLDALNKQIDAWLAEYAGSEWSDNRFHDFVEQLLRAQALDVNRDRLVDRCLRQWGSDAPKGKSLEGVWRRIETQIFSPSDSAESSLNQRLSDLGIQNPEPWPDPVNGSQLLDEIEHELRQFITASGEHSYPLMALWALHTHCLDHEWLATSPRLVFTSPRAGCGKSTAMKALWCLAPRAIMASSMTAAVLFRVIDEVAPSVFVDELDSSPEMVRDIAATAKSGYRRNEASVLRCEGDDNTPTAYATFAAMAFAGIGKRLDGALESRCLEVVLHGRTQREAQEASRLKPREQSRLQNELLPQAIRWAVDAEPQLALVGDMPSTLAVDRFLDLIEPLWTIAQAIGGKWPQRFQEAITALQSSKEDPRTKNGDILLDTIRLAHAEANHRTDAGTPTEWHALRFTAAELWRGLTAIDNGKWCDGASGKPLTAHTMERALTQFAPPGVGTLAKRTDNPDTFQCIEASRTTTGGPRGTRAASVKAGRNRKRAIHMTDLQYAVDRYIKPEDITDI